jgi:phospholipase C
MPNGDGPVPGNGPVSTDSIEHVILLMLENRSFDQVLGRLKAVYPEMEGVDPAAPRTNPDFPPANPAIAEAETTNRAIAPDPPHELDDVLRQIQGPNLGFITSFAQAYPTSTRAERAQVMGYFPLGFFPALHTLAENFAICDHWFASVPASTWTNRLFALSGTSLGRVKMASGIFDPNWHVYDQDTIFDRLSERNKSWAIYYGDVPFSLLLSHELLHPFSFHPMNDFYEQVGKGAAEFPAFTLIEPGYFPPEENDGHPPTDVLRADALVANVYNGLRAQSDLWLKTLLVITFDEHGGFYDHVYPPKAVPPDNHTEEYTFDQLGVRVPAVLVSPWLRKGVISTVFDHTSLLKYMTDKWALGPLGNRTANANTFATDLRKLSAPRADTPASVPVAQPVPPAPGAVAPAFAARAEAVPAPVSKAVAADPAGLALSVPATLNDLQVSLVGFSHYLERTKTAPREPESVIGARAIDAMKGPHAQGAAAKQRVDTFLKNQKAGKK